MALALADLCRGVAGTPFGRWAGVMVGGIALDSRRVRPGDLFAALPGQTQQGTAFVREALARGARALLLPAGVTPPAGVPGLTSPEPRRAVSQLAATFFGHPSRRVRVFGVTGSNGKTTVATMLAQALNAGGCPAGSWTTDQVDSGARRFRPALTTPEAPDLQRFLHEVEASGMEAACLEVSSHAVVQQRIADVRFAAGAITSVTPDHLDFHGSFAAYLEAKRGFLLALPAGAVLAYNMDDPGAVQAVAGVRARPVGCSLERGAAVSATAVTQDADGVRCRLEIARELAPLSPAFDAAAPVSELRVPLLGRHNLTNAMLAATLALAAGIPLAIILRALAAFAAPARRLRIERLGGRLVCDDVAMNEASFDAVFRTFTELGVPEVVTVVALRGNRGPRVNADIARRLAHWDRCLRFAPVIASVSRQALSRYPLDYQVRPEEIAAFCDTLREEGVPVHLHDELEPAVREAAARLHPGGAMLLLGTFGMDDGLHHAREILGEDEAGPRYGLPRFQ